MTAVLKMVIGNALTAGVGWLGWRLGVVLYDWPQLSFGACMLSVLLIWFSVFSYRLICEAGE